MTTWTETVRAANERAKQPTDAPAGGDELDGASHRELQAAAKELGLSAAGSSDALRARIREVV